MEGSVHGDDLRREVVSFQSICIKSESEPTLHADLQAAVSLTELTVELSATYLVFLMRGGIGELIFSDRVPLAHFAQKEASTGFRADLRWHQ